jgi:hypothetical protein
VSRTGIDVDQMLLYSAKLYKLVRMDPEKFKAGARQRTV